MPRVYHETWRLRPTANAEIIGIADHEADLILFKLARGGFCRKKAAEALLTS
jgi:hypothetical protein